MVSVITTGGQQYIVTVGKNIEVKKLNSKVGAVLEFDDMLNKGQSVKGKIIADKKGKKVNILKFKNKNRYLKQRGSRDNYSILEITEIGKKTTKIATKSK